MRSRLAISAGTISVSCIALVTRGWAVGRPRIQLFDEIFYANDGLDIVIRGAERSFTPHPPLGKEMIGMGIATLGFTPIGWRSVAVLCGALTVGLTYICAARLTGHAGYALIAPAFILVDGIAFTTGRLALLDGFTALFATAALTLLVLWPRDRKPLAGAAVAGVLVGCATATKWSAVPLVPAVTVSAAVCWGGRRTALAANVAAVVLLTAIVTYGATYTPWIASGSTFGDCITRPCRGSVWERITQLPAVQRRMFDYDTELSRRNTSLAPAWHWIIQNRPTILAQERCKGKQDALCGRKPGVRTIQIMGNKVLWAAAVAALGLSVVAVVRRRAGWAVIGLPGLWAAALWLPWFGTSQTYTFYAAPIVPALAVAVVNSTYRLIGLPLASILLSLCLVGAAVDFALSWPTLG
jgi:dolichyl-phosphate-mannose--protein O-mannosyl transferase